MEDVLQQLWLAVGLMAAFIAGAVYWRRHHLPATAARTSSRPATLVYRDSPTVRVADSQRVDRARKVIRLKVGESLDLLPTPAAMPPRFRVHCKSIVDGSDLEAAHIGIEFGGAQLSCGPLVDETAFNEYVIPRASRDEHRSSVFYYHERGDSIEFMRAKLKSADPKTGQIELDVMQMHANWPNRFGEE
ncbi:hypothetical protein JM946_04475 [Steroidobacter sp. S1-65]|uniref:Uncharacterized protein n=1 Tax=Steroidobacter gossypii TaxID=2805490 RepID=A0ABS1WSM4_9GAMM|nr:hypothetical protein [Steroidobacter gossypii]MBM0103983.1 hypothetical protein [Steroidobacter gossypii]